MPFTEPQKQNALAPAFANARKPLGDYIQKFGSVDRLFELHQANATHLGKLVQAFYPDQLYSFVRDLTPAELQRLAGLSQATLNSLGEMIPSWVQTMLKVVANVAPTRTALMPLPNGTAGVPTATPNLGTRIDQTSTQDGLKGHVVTERNASGNATRNLIFDAQGNCVAEINFDNHGGTATSGHAHVYPVKCIPITGHHVSGTPHLMLGDYPPSWRQLPTGVNPHRALGT